MGKEEENEKKKGGRTIPLLTMGRCGGAASVNNKTNAIQCNYWYSHYYTNVNIPGSNKEFNPELEKAGRLADFIDLGELMALDALNREESCGGHFREEHQTKENEAKRNDDEFAYVAAWEKTDKKYKLHKEELNFENVKLTTRSYK